IDPGGVDEVDSSVSYALGPYLENLTLTGSAGLAGTGNALANAITGNSGNNVLTGGLGNDSLIGGPGQDTAVFSGARSGYTITKGSAGLTVSGPDGVDTLTGIERLQFADALIKTGNTLAD